MTNLDDFLNKKEKTISPVNVEIIDGTFACQNTDCNVVSYEAIMDSSDGTVHWTCTCGHRSRFKL